MPSLIQTLVPHPKRLFLIDGLGAFFTALLPVAVLIPFEPLFGMPRSVLLVLSGIALLLALYSFSCYRWVGQNWRPFLKLIWAANLSYCGLTAGLIIAFYHRLTWLGVTYFLVEIVLVVGLACIERRAFTRSIPSS